MSLRTREFPSLLIRAGGQLSRSPTASAQGPAKGSRKTLGSFRLARCEAKKVWHRLERLNWAMLVRDAIGARRRE